MSLNALRRAANAALDEAILIHNLLEDELLQKGPNDSINKLLATARSRITFCAAQLEVLKQPR